MTKSDQKLKQKNNHDLFKTYLSVSGVKLLKLIYTWLKVFSRIALVAGFPFSRKMLTSKKGKELYFYYSKERSSLRIVTAYLIPVEGVKNCIKNFGVL